MNEICLLVPTFNEAQNIERMVSALLSLQTTRAVLVVDDHSPDGTGDIVKTKFPNESKVRLFERDGLKGRGPASVFGYREFLKTDAEWLCEIDADFQEDPADIARLFDAALKNRADLVVGSRYVAGGTFESEKSWLSKAARFCMRTLFRSKIRDVTCSFHLVHRRVLEKISLDRLDAKTFFIFAQLHLLTERAGFRCVEVPCHFPARENGDSKIHFSHVVKFGMEGLQFWRSLLFERQ